MLAIGFSGGSTVTYRYDPWGRRIETNNAGTIVRDVYNGANLHLEFNAANQLQAVYSGQRALDSTVQMQRGTQSFTFLVDGVGSTRALADASGNLVQQYSYDAVGRPAAAPAPIPHPLTFQGRPFEPSSGLYDLRMRSQDPLVADNPYPFATNNPVARTDPSGMDAAAKYAETEVYVVQDEAGNCYVGITKQGIEDTILEACPGL